MEFVVWEETRGEDHGHCQYSQFVKRYPQFLSQTKDGRRAWSELGWSFPEVMDRRVGLFREVIGYEPDGVYFDFVKSGDDVVGRLDAGGAAGDFLDDLVRLRAVQDFTPAQALAFLFSLKKIIRDELREANHDAPHEELFEFEARIDRLALSAFEIYARCREQLFEIRMNQMRRDNHVLIERFNRMTSSDSEQTTEEDEELAQGLKKVMQ